MTSTFATPRPVLSRAIPRRTACAAAVAGMQRVAMLTTTGSSQLRCDGLSIMVVVCGAGGCSSSQPRAESREPELLEQQLVRPVVRIQRRDQRGLATPRNE